MGLLSIPLCVSTYTATEMKPVLGVERWWLEVLLYCLSEDVHLMCPQGDSGSSRKAYVNLTAGFTAGLGGFSNVSFVSPGMKFKLI